MPAEDVYGSHLEAWINENEEALRVQFEEAVALPTNPLFTQPESFLIFERLSNDKARLERAWPDEVPASWLSEVADAWGASRS